MKCLNKGSEIVNAKITNTKLGYEDHGILTVSITTESEGWGQGFGGYALDAYVKSKDKRMGTQYGMEFVIKIMNVLEVENWEDLKGKFIRVDRESIKIHGIGHLLKDQWFYPTEDQDLKEMADEYIKK